MFTPNTAEEDRQVTEVLGIAKMLEMRNILAYKLLRQESIINKGRNGDSSSVPRISMSGSGDRHWLNIRQPPCPRRVKMFYGDRHTDR